MLCYTLPRFAQRRLSSNCPCMPQAKLDHLCTNLIHNEQNYVMIRDDYSFLQLRACFPVYVSIANFFLGGGSAANIFSITTNSVSLVKITGNHQKKVLHVSILFFPFCLFIVSSECFLKLTVNIPPWCFCV